MSAIDPTQDLRSTFDDARMTRGQVIVVVLAVLIAGLDGFDVQAMAFVAPVVSKAWAIDKAMLGAVLASSLFGMAGGSLGLSPFADLLGRRPLVLAGLLLMTVGSLLSSLSPGVGPLALSRAVTGLGIGVMVSLTTTIAAEFTNARRRAFAVATTTVGFSVGGVTGGLLSSAILRGHPWQWVFGSGAIAGAVILVLTAIWLTESPLFLMDRAPPNALRRLNRILPRLGHAPLTDLPPTQANRPSSYRALFSPAMIWVTVRFATVFLLMVTASYYLLSWLPQLVADAGYPASTASLVTALTSLVGIAGGLIFAGLARRVGPQRLASFAMLGFAASLAGLGLSPPTLVILMLAATACGFFLSATTAVFYATLTSSFPPLMRVSGIGFVMGFGRLLSGLGPYLAGVMFAAGLTRTGVSLAFAGLAALAGLLLASGLRKGTTT